MPAKTFENVVIETIELAGQGPSDTQSGFIDFSNRATLEAVAVVGPKMEAATGKVF
jgi:hypothetical protein